VVKGIIHHIPSISGGINQQVSGEKVKELWGRFEFAQKEGLGGYIAIVSKVFPKTF
jgi:hypothetical protein